MKSARSAKMSEPSLLPPRYIFRPHSSDVTISTSSWTMSESILETVSDASMSTRTLHNDGLLGVQEWGVNIITYVAFGLIGSIIYTKECTQVLDNRLHTYGFVSRSCQESESPVPALQYLVDVDSLNDFF